MTAFKLMWCVEVKLLNRKQEKVLGDTTDKKLKFATHFVNMTKILSSKIHKHRLKKLILSSFIKILILLLFADMDALHERLYWEKKKHPLTMIVLYPTKLHV